MKKYTKYKNSNIPWLGDVPEHWEILRLGSKFNERKEKVSDKDFSPLSVTKLGILPQLKNAAKSNDGDNRKRVNNGDFVINSRSDRKGSSGLSNLTGSVSLINIVIKPNNYFGKFSHFLLKSIPFQEEFYRYGSGIVADLWSTQYSDMRKIMIPVPEFSEQIQISRYLDWKVGQINKFIKAKKRILELLKEQKQAIINDAVTGKFDVRTGKPYPKYKPSGVEWLGDIPEEWEVRRLKNVAKIIVSSVDKNIYLNELQVKLCNYTDVYKNEKIDQSIAFKYGSCNKEELRKFQLFNQDVIITKDSETPKDIGVPALVNADLQNVVCGYHLAIIRSKKEYLLGSFLSLYLKNKGVSRYFESESNGITRFGLGKSSIENTLILIPKIKVQKHIVSYIQEKTQAIDQTISRIEREIELIKEYKDRLIADVVTGKVDVRGIEVPEVIEDIEEEILEAENEELEEIEGEE